MPALEPDFDGDARSDAEVILAIQQGDDSGADELYRRHHRAALAFAESVAGRTLAPDLVADAFVRILALLKRGQGPSAVFRSYLYTTIRNLHVDHVRHHARQTSLPDFGPLEAEFAHGDGLDDHFEHALVKKAFTSLPDRWQIALWYTTVEGVSLEQVGKCLGVAPNAVAALTFRAREGLRQAYLAEHLSVSGKPGCEDVWELLPRYVRGALRGRMRETVEEHLEGCRTCSAAVVELGEVNSDLRGVLLVALLGVTAAGYLERALGTATPSVAAAGTAVKKGAGSLTRIAGALATAAASVALVLSWPHDDPPGSDSARRPGTPTAPGPEHPPPPEASSSADPPAARDATRLLSFRPGTAQVELGDANPVRLTTTSPSWFHVGMEVSAGGAPTDRLTLVVRGTWSAYHVHRESGYGAWACSGTRAGLTCRLPQGSTGSLDLGLDLQVARRVSLTVTARGLGEPVTRTVVVG